MTRPIDHVDVIDCDGQLVDVIDMRAPHDTPEIPPPAYSAERAECMIDIKLTPEGQAFIDEMTALANAFEAHEVRGILSECTAPAWRVALHILTLGVFPCSKQ